MRRPNEPEPINEIVAPQRAFCHEQGVECVPSTGQSKLGFALRPSNGLRHPPEGDTNGWYVWCGEELSPDPEFFSPLHTEHLSVRYPEALAPLGLHPGYRFLLAGGHLDFWFDPDLLIA